MFKKEQKGFDCVENPDGSATCKRIIRTKQGDLIHDGQEVTIAADPSDGCSPRIIGNMTVMDEEIGNFDEMAKKVAGGCKNRQSRGYTQ